MSAGLGLVDKCIPIFPFILTTQRREAFHKNISTIPRTRTSGARAVLEDFLGDRIRKCYMSGRAAHTSNLEPISL